VPTKLFDQTNKQTQHSADQAASPSFKKSQSGLWSKGVGLYQNIKYFVGSSIKSFQALFKAYKGFVKCLTQTCCKRGEKMILSSICRQNHLLHLTKLTIMSVSNTIVNHREELSVTDHKSMVRKVTTNRTDVNQCRNEQSTSQSIDKQRIQLPFPRIISVFVTATLSASSSTYLSNSSAEKQCHPIRQCKRTQMMQLNQVEQDARI